MVDISEVTSLEKTDPSSPGSAELPVAPQLRVQLHGILPRSS